MKSFVSSCRQNYIRTLIILTCRPIVKPYLRWRRKCCQRCSGGRRAPLPRKVFVCFVSKVLWTPSGFAFEKCIAVLWLWTGAYAPRKGGPWAILVRKNWDSGKRKKGKGKGRKDVGGVWVKSSKKSGSEIVSKAHLFENWAGQRQGSRPVEEPALRLEISFLKHFSWWWHFCNLLFILRKCTTLNCKSSSSCFRDW